MYQPLGVIEFPGTIIDINVQVLFIKTISASDGELDSLNLEFLLTSNFFLSFHNCNEVDNFPQRCHCFPVFKTMPFSLPLKEQIQNLHLLLSLNHYLVNKLVFPYEESQ